MSIEKKEKKVYRDGLGEIKNPATSLFGKILIWVLSILMVASIFLSLIFTLIHLFE